MRSVSATLEAAQSSSNRTPYVQLVLTSYDGGTSYDLSLDGTYGNRILLLDYSEEAYNDYAVVILRNSDRGLPEDLRGFWTEFGLGDVTPSGIEYSTYPRLWVKHQQTFSSAGKLYTILELEGMWSKLRETKIMLGSPPYYNISYDSSTPYEIAVAVLAQIDPAMALQALVEDDGIIDTFTPLFSINETQLFEDGGSIIYRLLQMTKSFMRPKPSLEFEVKYPLESDSADVTYNNNIDPKFYQFSHRQNLRIPNHIYCIANEGSDGLFSEVIVAEATNDDSIAAYGDVPDIVLAPSIDNETDAENRAASILSRVGQEELAGSLTTKHDCRVELYDMVGVVDSRGA